jgi:hypothetical protein
MSANVKPVVFTLRLVPNFLWHMLAVGKIGYDSDYAEWWRHTVAEDDLLLLDSHRALLKFGEGEGGELAAFFAMLPAWLPIKSLDELRIYFEALDRTLEERSLRPISAAFPQADWNDRMLAEDLVSMDFPPNTEELRVISKELGAVYLRCFGRYETEVWPLAVDAMRGRASELSLHFAHRDFIAEWEQMLGLGFAGQRYEIVLCYANKNGPDYNSLGYCGNLCYYDKLYERTWQFVSHEIGTHLMIDTLLKLSKEPGINFRKLYAAFETLAMFCNRRLLGVTALAYDIPQFDDRRHLELYSRIYTDQMTPEQMIRAALEAE